MKPVVRDTSWCLIDLDNWWGQFPKIRVVSRWGYRWTVAPGVSPWTKGEQDFFHALTNGLINHTFAKARLRMHAAKANFTTTIPIEFTVGRALEKYKHWTVFVRKMPPGSNPVSSLSQVLPGSKTVYLDSADMQNYNLGHGPINALPHEFLHAIGGHVPDEYRPDSPFYHDKKSIMNCGRQLRNRHLNHITKTLNDMVPGAKFSLAA